MIEYLGVAYHTAQFVFGAGFVGTTIRWLHKSWQQDFENRVLFTFHNTDGGGPWQSANGVAGEIYLKAALNDAPGFFQPRQTGWRALKYWFRFFPYRLRHAFRRAFVLPTKEKADEVLRDLWKRGLLVRAGWDHTENEFYRLKN
jgi:hypothetical protein